MIKSKRNGTRKSPKKTFSLDALSVNDGGVIERRNSVPNLKEKNKTLLKRTSSVSRLCYSSDHSNTEESIDETNKEKIIGEKIGEKVLEKVGVSVGRENGVLDLSAKNCLKSKRKERRMKMMLNLKNLNTSSKQFKGEKNKTNGLMINQNSESESGEDSVLPSRTWRTSSNKARKSQGEDVLLRKKSLLSRNSSYNSNLVNFPKMISSARVSNKEVQLGSNNTHQSELAEDVINVCTFKSGSRSLSHLPHFQTHTKKNR